MVNTVNKIPSINLPLTNEQGIIHPIWYEFLRSFISSVGDTSGGSGSDNTVIAGSGISGTGAVNTVNVGQGQGISVDDESVSVNILGQVNVSAALEDEILISDASDGSRIKKTSLRDVSGLAASRPGGETTQIQYNVNGEFGGVTGFTADSVGNLAWTGDVALGNDVHFYWPSGSPSTYGIGGEGGTPYLRGQSNAYKFEATSVGWSMGVGTGSTAVWSASTGAMTMTGLDIVMSGSTAIKRSITASITASTTQTQGQQPLTRDINEISVCANANDTVTLPGAAAARQCLVINNGAQTLQVFPASGDDLGAGVNTSTTIAAGSRKLFVAYDSTNYVQVI
jgi:hypothetical protein